MSDHVLQKSYWALCSLDIGLLWFLLHVSPIEFNQWPPNIQHCTVQCVLFVPSLRRLSSVAVARPSLRPTVLISNPLVWVKLRDFLVPSAPGLKVPVGLGFSPTLWRAALPIRFPQVYLVSSLIPTVFDASLIAQLPERCVGVMEAVKGSRSLLEIRRPRPTQGGARQGIRHFPPTIWKLATATATATAAAAVLFCAMVFSRPGPTFLQQPAAGAAGRQQQSSQQSRSR